MTADDRCVLPCAAHHSALALAVTMLTAGYVPTTALGHVTTSSGGGMQVLTTAPTPRQFTLENWAWVKLRNLPLSEPLQIANGTATDLTKLTIVLTLLASIQIVAILNLMSLLSRSGALTILPFAAHCR